MKGGLDACHRRHYNRIHFYWQVFAFLFQVALMRGKKGRSRRAYLIRCWQEGGALPGRRPQWRFSLEEVTCERRRLGFGSLKALIAFFQTELAEQEPEPFDESG